MDIETLSFKAFDEAVEYLRSEGFSFQEPPNLWKKNGEGNTQRAEIHISGSQHATVVICKSSLG